MSLLVDDETGLVLIAPDWPDCPPNIKAYSSTRLGGVSLAPYGDLTGDGGLNLGDHVGDLPDAVLMNRYCLSDYFPASVTFLSQIHGILAVDAASVDRDEVIQADASFSFTSDVACAVLTADCLPILIAAKNGQCVAAIHAGWRGLAAGVIESTLSHLKEQGAQEFTAWLGPAIGPNAFEVGVDVVDAFVQGMPERRQYFKPLENDGKFLADIYGLARSILKEQKIDSVAGGNYCTFTQDELFYSYRRDGVTGRMASWIWMA